MKEERVKALINHLLSLSRLEVLEESLEKILKKEKYKEIKNLKELNNTLAEENFKAICKSNR